MTESDYILEAYTPCLPATEPELITGDDLANCAAYVTDESRNTGWADALTIPRSVAEVVAALRHAATCGWPVTVSGGRTGITAGAVPRGGLVISLERMNRILGLRQLEDGRIAVRCEAGVRLSELQKALHERKFSDISQWGENSRNLVEELRRRHLFFPPDPTETSATLGGIAACNASGAHTFRYGPTRQYVQALTVALADGTLLRLERGAKHAAADGTFAVRRTDGTLQQARVPQYRQPRTKNAAGYFSADKMDLVDLFIGAEGTLGAILEVDVTLVEAPRSQSAAMLFCRSEAAALALTHRLREQRDLLGIEAIEYIGPRALRFLRRRRQERGAASGVPECLPQAAEAILYLDLARADDSIPEALTALAQTVTAHGCDPGQCWSADTHDERERLRLFRHALPEAVNERIADIRRDHPAVSKLGTDMAVPDACLDDIVRLYRTGLDAAGLDHVMFGHIGDNHLHVNILPRTPEEYEAGRKLYISFARNVVDMGGSPAAEHGIGKLKIEFLKLLVGERGIDDMKRVKRIFDPDFRLGKGTLFEFDQSHMP